jgi:hypothetical protein
VLQCGRRRASALAATVQARTRRREERVMVTGSTMIDAGPAGENVADPVRRRDGRAARGELTGPPQPWNKLAAIADHLSAAGDLHSARSGGRRVNGGGGGHQPHGRDRDRSTSPPRVSCDIQRPPVPRSSERSAFRRGHWAVGRPSVRVTCLPLSCCGQPVGESSQVSCRP